MYQKEVWCRWEMLCMHVYRISQFMAVGFYRDQMCCSHSEPACHTCFSRFIFPENIFRVDSAHGMSYVLFELSLSGELLCFLTWAGAFTEPLGLRAFVVVVRVRYIGMLWLWAFFKKGKLPFLLKVSGELAAAMDFWKKWALRGVCAVCPPPSSPIKLQQWKK